MLARRRTALRGAVAALVKQQGYLLAQIAKEILVAGGNDDDDDVMGSVHRCCCLQMLMTPIIARIGLWYLPGTCVRVFEVIQSYSTRKARCVRFGHI